MMKVLKKPATFPQGTQRIARIDQTQETVDGPISDAELASALVGSQPMEARRAKRVTAYSAEPVAIERPILTVA